MGYYGFIRQPRVLVQARLVKRCTKCGEEHPNTDQYFYRRSKEWMLSAQCKECERRYRRERYRQNPEVGATRVAGYHRRYQQKKREDRWLAEGRILAPRHYWTSVRASVELGVMRETLCKWAKEGKVPAVRHGRVQWRFDPEVIRALAREREEKTEEEKVYPRGRRHPRTAELARRKWEKHGDTVQAAD